MKRLLSVLLILVLLFTTGIVSLSAYGANETATEEEKNTQGSIMASRFETMLNNNYAYANDFSSVSALMNSAVISLLPLAEDQTLENSRLIDFMKNMYGVDPTEIADEEKEPITKDGITKILPVGFFKYEHTVNDVKLNEDGTYTVYSTAKGYEYENEVELEAISRFVPSSDSSFAYILASCELLLPEENTENIEI